MTIVREESGWGCDHSEEGEWLGVCDPIVRKEGGLCQIC